MEMGRLHLEIGEILSQVGLEGCLLNGRAIEEGPRGGDKHQWAHGVKIAGGEREVWEQNTSTQLT